MDGDKPEDSPYSGNNIDPGSGYQTKTETIDGVKWTIYYRCKNCGVCTEYSKEVYRECEDGTIKNNTNGNTKGSGTVPIRWCSVCGINLYNKGITPYTVATWAQKHVPAAPEIRTLAVKAGNGGSVSGTVTVSEGNHVVKEIEMGAGIALHNS